MSGRIHFFLEERVPCSRPGGSDAKSLRPDAYVAASM